MSETLYYGIYQGIVTNLKDPEKRGRIKVKCPDVLGDDEESAWCDPMVPVAYDNGGDFCIPAKDEAVWLMFIAGDSNRPVWLGGWWQKNMSPLGSNYSSVDKTRIISYSDCTITLKEGTISINVGEGDFDLKIADGKVSVKGDLEVSGKITSKSLKVTTTAEAATVTADTVKASGVSLSSHKHSGVESGGSTTGGPV